MKKVIVDCERMKYDHTGLYHYCLQLGLALERNKDQGREDFYFYTRPSNIGVFGPKGNYIKQHSLQKFFLPSLKDYVVWHATYQATNYFPSLRKIKIVLTIHDINFMHDDSKVQFKRERELKKLQKKINRADHIVAISQFTLNDVRQHLKLDDKAVSVIYNGCNIEEISCITPPRHQPDKKFLYTIGTITDKKNFHVLPALLVNNDYQLIISGITQSDEYKERIVQEARVHGVADRLIFTGSVSENDKQWYLKNCEAFLFPSLAEGFGLPVIEAMYFGKPVILSTLTALPEVGGDAAYYFMNFEQVHMQQVLKDSLAHYNANAYMKEKVKERATMFDWDKTAAHYLEIYRNLY